MEEAQQLCDEVAIMDNGRIIARGAPQALIRAHCQGVTVALPRESFRQPPEQLPFSVQNVDGLVRIQTDNIDACLRELLAYDVDMSDMAVQAPSLENVFLNLTGRHLRD